MEETVEIKDSLESDEDSDKTDIAAAYLDMLSSFV
jgi:hypothetical protein